MRIVLGSDHGGFALKEHLRQRLSDAGHLVLDVGTHGAEPVDYPDSARDAAQRVLTGQAERGVIVCGSGVGASVAANKIRGIRAGLCHDTFSAHQGVEDDDMNVLCLGARVVGPELAWEIVATFLGASFRREDRFLRRLAKIGDLEREAGGCAGAGGEESGGGA
jgi:ribose 5-phosphate isomerase B